ncbi:hypothetical protein BGX34_003122 [Mortierella sp. NVP85]|nr:hypothetical protein BGX34_003122 [Mortierella sp. NVP85]
MSSSHTSIFDIPHIVDELPDHLSSEDIWNCYRVSRTWPQAFNLHRYKNMRFTCLDPYQTWSILHNMHRIRNLTADLADADYFLDARCTRFKSFIFNNVGYTETEPSDNEWAEYAEWMHIPWLEDVHDIRVVTATIVERCPTLKMFDLTIANSDISYVDTLVRVYPMVPRSVTLRYLWRTRPGEFNAENLIEALLMHSANTLEVLKVSDNLHNVVHDIMAVLEGFPNLKKLETPGTQREDVEDEEAISVARKIDVLWNTSKSVKSLKTLSLHWSHETYQKIMSMNFERGMFYMKQIGLPEMTQQETAWMGLQWTSIADHVKSEESSKLMP